MNEPIEGEVISRELVVQPSAPATLYGTNEPATIVEQATKQATVLAKIIKDQKLSTNIGGRHHVRVEGWTTCGALVGVFPVLVWSRRVDDGWEARVEARTMAGAVVGAAEAECLRSERTWSTRDDYALRSMAQTRATSKALRQPLGWIVTLAGFDPTPEEEMPREEAPRRAPVAISGGQERSGAGNGHAATDDRLNAQEFAKFWRETAALGYKAPEVFVVASEVLEVGEPISPPDFAKRPRADIDRVLEALKEGRIPASTAAPA